MVKIVLNIPRPTKIQKKVKNKKNKKIKKLNDYADFFQNLGFYETKYMSFLIKKCLRKI